VEQKRFAAAGCLERAEDLNSQIHALEARRLALAAFHDTVFWLEQMALPRGGKSKLDPDPGGW